MTKKIFKYIPFTIVLNRTFMYEKSLKNLEKIDYLINNDYESLNGYNMEEFLGQ